MRILGFLFFESPQSKLFLILSLLSIIVSLIKYFNIKIVLIQIIFYLIVSHEIDCYVYGGCGSTGWFRCLLPLLTIVLFILDYLKLYNLEKIIKILTYYIEKVNLVNKKELVVNNHKIFL